MRRSHRYGAQRAPGAPRRAGPRRPRALTRLPDRDSAGARRREPRRAHVGVWIDARGGRARQTAARTARCGTASSFIGVNSRAASQGPIPALYRQSRPESARQPDYDNPQAADAGQETRALPVGEARRGATAHGRQPGQGCGSETRREARPRGRLAAPGRRVHGSRGRGAQIGAGSPAAGVGAGHPRCERSAAHRHRGICSSLPPSSAIVVRLAARSRGAAARPPWRRRPAFWVCAHMLELPGEAG